MGVQRIFSNSLCLRVFCHHCCHRSSLVHWPWPVNCCDPLSTALSTISFLVRQIQLTTTNVLPWVGSLNSIHILLRYHIQSLYFRQWHYRVRTLYQHMLSWGVLMWRFATLKVDHNRLLIFCLIQVLMGSQMHIYGSNHSRFCKSHPLEVFP